MKRRSGETGPALAAVLREDADRLLSGAELPAADRYASLIYGDTTTAIDYIPSGALIVMDQPSRFSENARAYIKRVTEDVTSLTRAAKLISKPDDYFIPFDAAMRRLGAMALYMACLLYTSSLSPAMYMTFSCRGVLLRFIYVTNSRMPPA